MDSKKLIENIAKATDIDKEKVAELIDVFADILIGVTAEGDSVALPSFGSFEVKKREERITMHPSTGKKLLVPPKLTLTFRPSSVLKQRVRRAEND